MSLNSKLNDWQQYALNPLASNWVCASAGTGKTKILTDRVLRLLLAGAEFRKILCLTFTNAAASEMQTRINAKLAQWANSTDNELASSLRDILLGKNPSKHEMHFAKSLYNQLLTSPEQINIHTIHSFCHKILKLFPLESGISPSFQILDEIRQPEIITKIKNQFYLEEGNPELFNFFITNFHEMIIAELHQAIIGQKSKFKNLFCSSKQLSIESSLTFHASISESDLLALIKAQDFSSILNDAKDFSSIDHIITFFLTKDGEKRQRLINKKLATTFPNLLQELLNIQEKVYQFVENKKLKQLIEYSNLLVKLASNVINNYEAYKKENNLLDYDDLIYFTKLLLTNNKSKDWVLYRLDGGIDHLLVDEAQDTSFEQWEIINALITEFYAGEGARKTNRSIFVVGDEKQSIFSFQGANIEYFHLVQQQLTQKITNANKPFNLIPLTYSYRSTQEILDVVHSTFQHIQNTSIESFIGNNLKINAFRQHHRGKVELWSLISSPKPATSFWSLPAELINNSVPSEKQLAIKIASFIKSQIDNKVILPSTGQPAKYQDFMILVRTRDKFTIEIINQLKSHGLETNGPDRMLLKHNLAILDIISAAKFALSPYDDLNLACLLKSPIIALNEEDLLYLCSKRGNKSIWQSIREYVAYNFEQNTASSSIEFAYQKLLRVLDIYKISHSGNFFDILVDGLDLRAALINDNGAETEEAINSLLTLGHNYARTISTSLQSFIYWFENNEVIVKSDIENSNKIRVMTVHAAKGLQAPVVILGDTTSLPTNSDSFIWTEQGPPIACIQEASSPKLFQELRAKEQEKIFQEYLRLLYVAMTRAADYLIVCGYHNTEIPANCWYQLISKALKELGKIDEEGKIVYGSLESHFYQSTPDNIATTKNFIDEKTPSILTRTFNIPPKLLEDIALASSTKTNMGENNKTLSPLIKKDYLQYGRVFHKVLEDAVNIKDFSRLKHHPLIATMPCNLQEKIRRNIDKLLTNQDFTELIKQELRTEVSIGINRQNLVEIGRIDLLAIQPDQMTIIDYKSDASPPLSKELIPLNYTEQLDFYKHIIQSLYPQHQLTCKILWLENGQFMTV